MGNIDSSSVWETHDRFKAEARRIQFFRQGAIPTTFSTAC
jgi:hypothetical protein